MGLADRLRQLDARAVTSLRQPGEPDEAFLRRVADHRWPQSRQMLSEIQQALQEFFGDDRSRKRAYFLLMRAAAWRAGYGGMEGVMLGLLLGLHPLTQLLLGAAVFAVSFAVLRRGRGNCTYPCSGEGRLQHACGEAWRGYI